MATILQLRRGTTEKAQAYTGAEGELFVDVDNNLIYLHDGETQGGHEISASIASVDFDEIIALGD